MKLLHLWIVLFLISWTSVAVSDNHFSSRQVRRHPSAFRQANHQSSTVELKQSYEFSTSGETRRIRFIVPLPQNLPDRQKVLSIRYSPKPTRIIEDRGKRYAEFVFDRPEKQIKTTIQIKAELFRYDLITAMKNRKHASMEEEGLEVFLKEERFIEKDHDQIQEIAGGIAGRTEVDAVLNIYDYVLDHMEYAAPNRRSRGAVRALQRGKGDCTEYADLFVALCRAKDIPARVVTGFTVRFDSESPKHNWAEVYLQEYGWVPFDPSAGDIENAIIRGRAFSRMGPVYFYLSHIRNDEMLGAHSFGAYVFWGDKPRFKESIDFNFLPSSIQRGK